MCYLLNWKRVVIRIFDGAMRRHIQQHWVLNLNDFQSFRLSLKEKFWIQTLFIILARRHGPKGTWRHHARIPIRILSCSYHHWLVGSWYWCPTSVPCHQLWLAHQQRKLHSQVCNFTYYRVSKQGLVKISKNLNFAFFEIFTRINDDKLEQLLILMIFKW